MSDTEILDWLEKNHTLHYAVEVLYVVEGYQATGTRDGNVERQAFGKTYREALANLSDIWEAPR